MRLLELRSFDNGPLGYHTTTDHSREYRNVRGRVAKHTLERIVPKHDTYWDALFVLSISLLKRRLALHSDVRASLNLVSLAFRSSRVVAFPAPILREVTLFPEPVVKLLLLKFHVGVGLPSLRFLCLGWGQSTR